MIASFDLKFQEHKDRISHAERQYTLIAAATSDRAEQPQSQSQPRRRLSNLLRRITGTPAAA